MLRVEVCTRALRASQNVKKRCAPCVFALPERVHGRVLWGCQVVGFLCVAPPLGGWKRWKMCKAPRNHKVRGRARREARVPVVETILLRRGADVAVGVKERLLVHRPRLRPATAVDGAHDCPEILHSFGGGCEFCGDELDLVRPHRLLQLLLRGSAKKLVARLSTSPPAIRLCPVALIHEHHHGHKIICKPSLLSPLSLSAHLLACCETYQHLATEHWILNVTNLRCLRR